jgi:hypothetical protein
MSFFSKMENRNVKQVLSWELVSCGGKGVESEYSGNTIYSCMKMGK